ncbi:hypothetical protein TRFO_37448 [Tritrichomonas foetus]|uniref:Uncharacterized protein n=1 Tax=Tritrichomonas foetus TaxID=1144522 RepID=A0A1J4JB55_9EUKA|nr:hypothetical protein TRFO_37448 [Tritrichomonas foetus]|eukprot:OHS96406.1 hypothetical protein TRFO_37448 [Tritrichomonas foetus]
MLVKNPEARMKLSSFVSSDQFLNKSKIDSLLIPTGVNLKRQSLGRSKVSFNLNHRISDYHNKEENCIDDENENETENSDEKNVSIALFKEKALSSLNLRVRLTPKKQFMSLSKFHTMSSDNP